MIKWIRYSSLANFVYVLWMKYSMKTFQCYSSPANAHPSSKGMSRFRARKINIHTWERTRAVYWRHRVEIVSNSYVSSVLSFKVWRTHVKIHILCFFFAPHFFKISSKSSNLNFFTFTCTQVITDVYAYFKLCSQLLTFYHYLCYLEVTYFIQFLNINFYYVSSLPVQLTNQTSEPTSSRQLYFKL